MSSSVRSKSSSSGSRGRSREELKRTALGSTWIRRLRSETTTTRSHVTSPVPIPFHLKSCFALHFLPKNSPLLPPPPPPRPPRHEIVRSSELTAGFGPFRFRAPNARALCTDGHDVGGSPFFQYRRQLATVISGNNGESRFQGNLGPAQELIDESPSRLPVKGSASRDEDGYHPAASRILMLSVSILRDISVSDKVIVFQASQKSPSRIGTWGDQREETLFLLYVQYLLRLGLPRGKGLQTHMASFL